MLVRSWETIMAKRKPKTTDEKNGNGAVLGFETKLWSAADKLRNNMDAAEYKHVVLGLIFLKYISDTFAERHTQAPGRPKATGPTRKTLTSTAPRGSFGSRRSPAGSTASW